MSAVGAREASKLYPERFGGGGSHLEFVSFTIFLALIW